MSQGTRAISHDGPKLTGRAAGLLVILTLLVVLALVPARQFLEQRGRISDLERRTAELVELNAGLRQRIAMLDDPSELERIARECLGMVAPGEIALVVPGSQPERADC
ncbi:MAG: FtsB family cell division protein [Actinomycetota bacterium]|jgi:cell division protein FtsB